MYNDVNYQTLEQIRAEGDGVKVLIYKINVLEKLKDAGYNTTKLRKEKLLNESAIQYLRNGRPIGAKALDDICRLLNTQPGAILEYVDDGSVVGQNKHEK